MPCRSLQRWNGLIAAALERIHDIDPEIRRQALGTAAAYVYEHEKWQASEGDPYLEAFYRERRQRPGGFF